MNGTIVIRAKERLRGITYSDTATLMLNHIALHHEEMREAIRRMEFAISLSNSTSKLLVSFGENCWKITSTDVDLVDLPEMALLYESQEDSVFVVDVL